MSDKTEQAMGELAAFRLPSIPRYVACVVLFALARVFFRLGNACLAGFKRVRPASSEEEGG